jgi:hypothetical protein
MTRAARIRPLLAEPAVVGEAAHAHHEGAIAMAEAAEKRGQHEEIKELAAVISLRKSAAAILGEHASGEHHG